MVPGKERVPRRKINAKKGNERTQREEKLFRGGKKSSSMVQEFLKIRIIGLTSMGGGGGAGRGGRGGGRGVRRENMGRGGRER
jgi:hypothetical protein